MEVLKTGDFKPAKLPDEQVVQRVLSGEKELFEILMRRYNQTLYRAVRSYLKRESDIEDTMQDTYLKAYRKLYQFQGDAAFSTWLIRIGINEALQNLRKQRRNNVISINENENIIRLSNVDQMNPEKKAIHHETRRLVEKAIDQLPEKYRVIYVLREVEGMSNAEISACLELTESNVKVRFHRAKKLLKERLYELSSDTTLFEFGDSKCDQLVDRVMEQI